MHALAIYHDEDRPLFRAQSACTELPLLGQSLGINFSGLPLKVEEVVILLGSPLGDFEDNWGSAFLSSFLLLQAI